MTKQSPITDRAAHPGSDQGIETTPELPRCPRCGGEIQATAAIRRWYTLRLGPDGLHWEHYADSDPEERYYCEHDHPLPHELVNTLPELPELVKRCPKCGWTTSDGGLCEVCIEPKAVPEGAWA